MENNNIKVNAGEGVLKDIILSLGIPSFYVITVKQILRGVNNNAMVITIVNVLI